MDPTEMAAVGETQNTLVQFKSYIDVHVALVLIGAFQ